MCLSSIFVAFAKVVRGGGRLNFFDTFVVFPYFTPEASRSYIDSIQVLITNTYMLLGLYTIHNSLKWTKTYFQTS